MLSIIIVLIIMSSMIIAIQKSDKLATIVFINLMIIGAISGIALLVVGFNKLLIGLFLLGTTIAITFLTYRVLDY